MTEDYAQWFATRLKNALGEMSQSDLLKLLKENGFEMTQARLSHYMQGRNYPDPPILMQLAKAIGVSADYLLGLTEDPTPVSELVEQIADSKGEGKINRLLRRLSKEQRQQVSSFTEYLLVQSGRAEEIARSNEAGFEAALNTIQRKHGEEVVDDLLDTLTGNFPDLAKLVGPVSPTKHKRVNKG